MFALTIILKHTVRNGLQNKIIHIFCVNKFGVFILIWRIRIVKKSIQLIRIITFCYTIIKRNHLKQISKWIYFNNSISDLRRATKPSIFYPRIEQSYWFHFDSIHSHFIHLI